MCFRRLTDNQTKPVRIFLSLSLSLSLAEHIASSEAQTGRISISRPKFNRANIKRDRQIKTLRQLFDKNAAGSGYKTRFLGQITQIQGPICYDWTLHVELVHILEL